MMKKSRLIGALALLALAAGAAVAQDPAIDINGDGMYSYPEVSAVIPEITEDAFTALDTSGDGLLDADEIAAGVAAGTLPG